ncbi:hypothetical protein AMATHDRAFT_51787 [Amanita thiersii Skay4041]|uniref:Apurinic-apyrimidinic endonuclease 1 n=1 Tax=Amanita thiersii Skay4041 TaxID=703135 RepID=A0A2A9NBM6_9AGAR|nr:hypothetical protein AMATHDRAFT_51787 [Amanita thiersii Skay4041]
MLILTSQVLGPGIRRQRAHMRQPVKSTLEAGETEHRERDKSCLWKVGAHVSAAGGVENAVLNAAAIGANAFALFLKSQRKWSSPALSSESISLFKSRLQEYDYSSKVVLPHGSYLINLGNPDPGSNGPSEKRHKSYECFLDDLRRCELLGLELYNFHPGSTVGAISTQECISLIAECINRAHKETKFVTTVIENMAGAGNVIGSDFAHLGAIIEKVENKSRVGVCLDTCHMFAAGYDIRTSEGWQTMLKGFDEQVGLSYLRGMHLNDSKADLGSKRDRHDNIGLGFLGIRTFRHILSDDRVQGIPLILETQDFEQPKEVWGTEIQTLQQLSKISDNELSETKERDLANSIRDAIKSVGGATNKKPRTVKAARQRKGKGPETDGEEEE